MEFYQDLKNRVVASATASVDLSEMHLLLQKEFDELQQFIAARDAEAVVLACDGIGTDDDLLIDVLCHRTREQLQLADEYFRKTSAKNKSMRERIKSETSGNYGKFMCAIVESIDAINAKNLKKAFDGLGCDKKVVNELFTTLSNAEIQGMRQAYERSTDSSLNDRLKSELGGQHEELILAILHRGRGEGPADAAAAASTAKQIHDVIKAGSSMMGGLSNKAESQLIDILVQQSPEQCIEIASAYEKAYSGKPSLLKTIESKLGGALEEGVLGLFRDPLDALCTKLKAATDGVGCNEESLTRILGGSSKAKCRALAERYQQKYGQDLRNVIKSETGGNYQKALLTWIDGPDPTNGWTPASDGTVAAEVDRLIKCIWDMRQQIASLDYTLLKKAAKGIGTDERTVVSVLCRRTKAHLDLLDDLFRERSGKSLREYIVAEMGGNLEDFLEYTQMEEDEFDAIMLFEAFKGIGCNEKVVVEVMTTRPYPRLHQARIFYEARNDHSLMDALIDELHGDLEYLCCRLLAGARGIAERKGDNLQCSPEDWADRLYNAGAGKFGTDEKTFIDFITGHSLAEVQRVAAAYEAKHGSSLEAAIISEFSGPLETALVNLLHDPLDIFCRYIKKFCDGIGTNEEGLNRVLGGNDKATVTAIASRYFQKYGKDLKEVLKSELSGDYQKACLAWIEPPSFSDGYLEQVVDRLDRAAPPPPPAPDVVPAELLPFPGYEEIASAPPAPPAPPVEAAPPVAAMAHVVLEEDVAEDDGPPSEQSEGSDSDGDDEKRTRRQARQEQVRMRRQREAEKRAHRERVERERRQQRHALTGRPSIDHMRLLEKGAKQAFRFAKKNNFI